MNPLRALLRSSFRAKVLVPVIVVMVTGLAVTTLVVNWRITHQFELEATRTLTAADEGFRNWRNNRAKNLLLRFSELRNEPRFRAAFQTGDSPTVRAQLNDLLKAADDDVKIVLYTTPKEEVIASAKRDPLTSLSDFISGSAPVVKNALQGEEQVNAFHVGDKLYDVVAVPVYDSAGEQIGALTFGLELSDGAAAELSHFTRSHIVLLAGDHVVVTTLLNSAFNARLAELYAELVPSAGRSGKLKVEKEILDGQHYYCAAGRFAGAEGEGTPGYLLLYSYDEARQALVATQQILLLVSGTAILLGSIFICILVGKATEPLRKLRDSAEAVGRGDFTSRVEVNSEDECGMLARGFNQMIENLKRSREELESAHAELVETSRRAGMAEVATGVLHNVGNVLTSVNVASTLMAESVKKSKAAYLPKLAGMLRDHQADIGEFLTKDPKGKQVLDYFFQLSGHLVQEQEAILQELAQMQTFIEHIKEIVKAQQSFSKTTGAPETLDAADLLEDALKMTGSGRSQVEVVKQFERGVKVTTEKHKVLQILVNLVRNARQACEGLPAEQKVLTLRVSDENHRVRIAVTDNGVGIAPDHLNRIFKHGFTTKKEGHGFGLHSSALTARGLGGELKVHSEGLGKGATFTLELPEHGAASSPSDTQTPAPLA